MRESLYASMESDLKKANEKAKRGWLWALLAFFAGMAFDRLVLPASR